MSGALARFAQPDSVTLDFPLGLGFPGCQSRGWDWLMPRCGRTGWGLFASPGFPPPTAIVPEKPPN